MSKIMFAGPSGIGKTTLAEYISEEWGISFLSGSVSDLLPQTKEMSHKDMLARDPQDLYMEDMQILNLRNKKFKDAQDFVSDRSYLDSAAYFLYKQADKQPDCEVEHFLELCKMLLNQQCTHLIFVRFHHELYKQWVTEDNDKRITSSFFQMEISSIMALILGIWGYRTDFKFASIKEDWYKTPKLMEYTSEVGHIKSLYGETKVLVLDEANLENRKLIINKFLSK